MNTDNPARLSSVATFVRGMSTTDKQDISDLLGQADVFANATWRRQDNFSEWMNYHSSRLEKHGCQKLGPLFTDPLRISSIDDLKEPFALKTFGVRDSPVLIDMAIDALNQSGYYDFCYEFIKQGKEASKLTMNQSVPCLYNEHGGISLMVCGLQAEGQILDRGGREVVLRIKGGEYNFDPRTYDRWREEVRAHLLRYGQQQLAHIEL